MKKVLFPILALVLAVSLAVPMAMPSAASNGSYVLYGIIGEYLVTVDSGTGDATEVAMLSGDPVGRMGAIAFNPNTGILYGLARGEGSYTPMLTTINMCTGEVTVIGAITLAGQTVYFAEGLAIDPDGTIYVSMSINGGIPGGDYYSETLATVDPDTAVATWVATITGTVQTEADGLEFVGYTLYATDDPGSGPTNIYTIDTGTGAATFKGTLSSPRFNNVNDMAYNPDTDLLYGFDPGAYTNGNPRHLCTISHPGTATAADIGETHTAAEFNGGRMSGIAWASVECLVEVKVDIKPTSCPNPLNVKSKGVLPVAILGTGTFDVTDVDPATVLLEGVAPLRWSLEDVATPFDGEITEGCCECCTIAGPDGLMDLTLKFDTQEIVAALDGVEDSDCLILTLTGELYDGTDIHGIDVIKIIKKGANGNGG